MLPQYIEYNGNKAKRIDEFYGYYITECGEVLSVKVRGGQGRINTDNPQPIATKEDKE